ncbi:MAG: class I SAM-dependent methyltransferase [Firmicutes bacterium]|nr:class I SAM-dependent methyltransferase [Bacillota bacterium]
MNITQEFYDSLASHYSKLFQDIEETMQEQAEMLDRIFTDNGYDKDAKVLDCACGIGTQTLGLASLGYNMSSSDISSKAMLEAKWEAVRRNLTIRFAYIDFRKLADAFKDKFDIIIAIDNALPHMTSKESLKTAVESIVNQLEDGGMFVASIRDYDALLKTKPPYSPPYIHDTENGQRVSFQTWKWEGENYKLVQYIIEDEENLEVKKFACVYRAVRRAELTELLTLCGCKSVEWKFPEETGFYQPIVIAKK